MVTQMSMSAPSTQPRGELDKTALHIPPVLRETIDEHNRRLVDVFDVFRSGNGASKVALVLVPAVEFIKHDSARRLVGDVDH